MSLWADLLFKSAMTQLQALSLPIGSFAAMRNQL
jgi:hypothetical protein